MRVRIIFSLKNKGALLPFHHQTTTEKMIREVMTIPDQQEPFMLNFSGLKGQIQVGREGLYYCSKWVTLVVSSLHGHIIHSFLERLFATNEWRLGDLILEPEWVEEEADLEFKNECRYLCISPIVIGEFGDLMKNKMFINPVNDEFSDALYETTMNNMELSGQYSLEQIATFNKFQIVPDTAYLAKIQKEGKKFARIYSYIDDLGLDKEVRGYTFPFTLFASPEVHNFIYHSGFGELVQKGYGMVDVADQVKLKTAKRMEKYDKFSVKSS